jgi:hypothetical protein
MYAYKPVEEITVRELINRLNMTDDLDKPVKFIFGNNELAFDDINYDGQDEDERTVEIILN